jgi:hypothetical protein
MKPGHTRFLAFVLALFAVVAMAGPAFAAKKPHHHRPHHKRHRIHRHR